MRQVLKKYIAVILIFCFIFMKYGIYVNAEESKGEKLKQKYKSEKQTENQKLKEIDKLNEKIDSSYSKRKNIKEKVKKDKNINSKYAGEYFDEDGNYVIMIADDMIESENSDICKQEQLSLIRRCLYGKNKG